jgi:hypothetical protein
MTIAQTETTCLDRYHARLDRKAAANVVAVWDGLVSLQGEVSRSIKNLNPLADQYPKLREFKWVSAQGAWVHLKDGAQGKGILDLVQYLSAGCSRDAAADFLEQLLYVD